MGYLLGEHGNVGQQPRRGGARLAQAAWLPVCYFALTLCFSPFLRSFENDTDEGLNLIKASLAHRGAQLYAELWSDQPPYFTQALSGLWSLTGESVLGGRLVVLASSMLLLISVAHVLGRRWGAKGALVGGLLVLLLPDFQRLSVSVMIGMPALALAMGAVAMAIEAHRCEGRSCLMISGVLMGFAALTKLFVLPLLPVVLIGIALYSKPRSRGRSCAIWAVAFVAAMLPGMILLVKTNGWHQLVSSHIAAAQVAEYRTVGGLEKLLGWDRMIVFALLALLGAVRLRSEDAQLAYYGSAWAVIAVLVLSIHRPLWYHQRLLLGLPLSLLASPVVLEAGRSLAGALKRLATGGRVARGATLGLVALSVIWVLDRDGSWQLAERGSGSGILPAVEGHPVLNRVRQLAAPSDLMLTDRPMFAFRAGLSVPAEVAVLSDKRIRSGLLSEDYLVKILRSKRPDFVLLERFRLPAVRAELRRTYQRDLLWDGFVLFVREDRNSSTSTELAEPGRDSGPLVAG